MKIYTHKMIAAGIHEEETRTVNGFCLPVEAVTPHRKTVVFTLKLEAGRTVFLSGGFNGWKPTERPMVYNPKVGAYVATLRLPVGQTYEYKFLIDGVWCADPSNGHAVPNKEGTYNSVLAVA